MEILMNIKKFVATTKKGLNKKYNDDIVNFNDVDGGTILYLADGATGVGDGRYASKIFSEECLQIKKILNKSELLNFMSSIDMKIMLSDYDCDTTGIILQIGENNIITGVSVGDSDAYLFTKDNIINLTKNQKRKPRLGNLSYPVFFEHVIEKDDKIFMATDGVMNILNIQDINNIIKEKKPSKIILEKLKKNTDDASFIIAS